eukprot:GHVU01138251.1.p1 GENE.GHVU01138251.1~~GHVU01138251.1.p1  ORF type:complete len:264 (-),score=87.78 GHVU01138251.1:479-1270(-)
MDDKLLLVEAHLLESKLLYSVKNIAKAKAALTACRTNANAIHCPPLLQAEVDLHAGCLQADAMDFRTSYSYFFEAFEAFNAAEDPRALQALKYVVLAKIMQNQAAEATAIISGKHGMKLAGRELQSLSEVAQCYKDRSLSAFEKTIVTYAHELKEDKLIKRHIGKLYDNLLEQNVLRVIEPYSRVELTVVAERLNLPLNQVIAKLNEMILDNKSSARMDQATGLLIIYDDAPTSSLYQDAIDAVGNLSQVVDALYEKAAGIAK